jgi:hypothetical protein
MMPAAIVAGTLIYMLPMFYVNAAFCLMKSAAPPAASADAPRRHALPRVAEHALAFVYGDAQTPTPHTQKESLRCRRFSPLPRQPPKMLPPRRYATLFARLRFRRFLSSATLPTGRRRADAAICFSLIIFTMPLFIIVIDWLRCQATILPPISLPSDFTIFLSPRFSLAFAAS